MLNVVHRERVEHEELCKLRDFGGRTKDLCLNPFMLGWWRTKVLTF
jgi:hypothetical protein